jgi:hypothetical protein
VANRFFFETGANVVIPPYGSLAVQYISSKWRLYDKAYDIRGAAAAAIVTAEAYADGIAGTGPTSFRQKGTNPIELWYPAGAPGAVGSAISVTKDKLYIMPFIAGKGGTLDRIGFWVVTAKAASHSLCGIYANKATGQFYPGALLLTGDNEDTASTGLKDTTITQVLTAGAMYWFAFTSGDASGVAVERVDGQTAYFGVQTDLASAINGYYVSRAYDGTLPNPFPNIAGATIIPITVPLVGCRFSS